MDNALACLRLFGIDLPAHPTREEVQAEYETVWRNLEGRSIESLIDLPLMTDPELQAAMQVLSTLCRSRLVHRLPFALHARVPHGEHQHAARDDRRVRARLWLPRGDPRPGLSPLPRGLPPRQARLRSCREARLRRLSERRFTTRWESTLLWTQPITSAIEFVGAVAREPPRQAISRTLATACTTSHGSAAAGTIPSRRCGASRETGLDFARRAGFRDVVDLIVSQQRFIATMQGRTATVSTFSDAQFDEATFEAQLTGDRMNTMICGYWILKLKARFLSGDYTEALAAAAKAEDRCCGQWPARPCCLDYFYYTALTVAALYENASADEQASGAIS